MLTTNDPSWILSSTIQGAATAIAIIAGFAIQQFLSAQSSEDNALFELGILQQKIEKTRNEISKFNSSLEEVKTNIYKPKVLGLIEMFPNYDAKQIWDQLSETEREDFTVDQVEAMWREVNFALREITIKITKNLIPQISEEQLTNLGFDLSEIDVETYLSAVSVYRSRNNQNWLSRFPGFRNALTGLTAFNLTLSEKRSNIYNNINEANADLSHLYEEEAIWNGRYELAQNSFSKKSFVWHALFIIAIGIGIPGYLLAKQDLSSSHNSRGLYFALLAGVLLIAINYFRLIVKKRINKQAEKK